MDVGTLAKNLSRRTLLLISVMLLSLMLLVGGIACETEEGGGLEEPATTPGGLGG